MLETFEKAFALAAPHWPALSWALIAMMIGQVMAHRVFTADHAARKRKHQWFWWWGRKTLPLHPVASGLLLGLVWVNPEGADPAWSTVASSMYFGASGTLSIWLYQLIKGLAKRQGIELELPGESIVPSQENE